MRNGLLAVFLSIGIAGATACVPDSTNDADNPERVGNPKYADAKFFRTLETMLPQPDSGAGPDQVIETSAKWDARDGSLNVSTRTRDEKGTLVTMAGLPESTMIDAFRISSDFGAHYKIKLANQQAIPCHLIVSAGSQAEVVEVENAPIACANKFNIGGKISNMALAGSRVTVTIGGMAFETQAAGDGSFEIDVYNKTADADVTIHASIGQIVVPVYSGTLNELLQTGSLSASAWAKEILGRRHARPMLAAN